MKKTILLTLLTSLITCANAQRHEIYDPNIKSLQVVAGQNWMSLPVIKLRGNSPNDIINIGFMISRILITDMYTKLSTAMQTGRCQTGFLPATTSKDLQTEAP